MDIPNIIKELAPLHNQYKNHITEKEIPQAIGTMWDIGEILSNYIDEFEVSPLSLFREIYGKSEGTKNIAQKSYIAREFQSRCLRVRKIFKHKDDIANTFPNITSVTAFTESMPFFDNPKYLLKGDDKRKLIALINSNLSTTEILNRIGKLQQDLIGINNPRNQRLKELEYEKNVFIDFYNHVYRLIQSNDYQEIANAIDIEYYHVLSKNLRALSQDGLKIYDFDIPSNVDHLSYEIGAVILSLIKEKTPIRLRRFRKLIPPSRMVKLAEMLHSLTSKNTYFT